jgi:hypothetical protein
MKIKTSDLTGVALDWAVGKAGGWHRDYPYSTDWAFGGPIIEREVIMIIHPKYDCWTGHVYDKHRDDESYTLDGPTPLIAAMRCYVATKLGDTVSIPNELIEE